MKPNGEPGAARLLDGESLDALERRWRESGWRGLERLRPGLTEEQMDAITAPLGLHLPVEARRWWGWHDGIASAGPGSQAVFGGRGLRYLTLDDAVAIYEERREIAATLAVDGEPVGRGQDDWWHPGWFPVTDGLGTTTIACDCTVPACVPTPIRSVRWDADEDFSFAIPRVASFGEMVIDWLDAIDRGAWWYDAAEDRWKRDWTRLDREQDLRRLT